MGAVKYLKIGNGFIWKPAGEGGPTPGKLVILLPRSMRAKKSAFVKLMTPEGEKLETLTFSSFYTEGDDRQIWRGKKPGKQYPKSLEVRTKYDGKLYAWKIRGPGKRHE